VNENNGKDKKEATKKKYAQDADTSLVFFEQEPEFLLTDWEEKRLRIAVYCRVSTDSENQASSFALQKKYYEDFVAAHPNWVFSKHGDENVERNYATHYISPKLTVADKRSGTEGTDNDDGETGDL